MLSGGMMGRNNGVTWFIDFEEKVGGEKIRDIEGGEVLGGNTMEAACILKEDKARL